MPEIILKLGETVVHTYSFDKEMISIGRSKDNDVIIETLSVSRNHARIRREDGRYVLIDLESANGTFVNGTKVSRAEIVDGDTVVIGKHQLVFREKPLSEEQAASEVFKSERTMLVDDSPVGVLVVLQGKQRNEEFQIERPETVIGRAEGCDVRLHDWFVSKRHAILRREGRKFTIRDFGKLTGVQVNGQTIRSAHPLLDGDEVKIGPVALKFMVRPAQPVPSPGARQPVELPYEDHGAPQLPQGPEEPRESTPPPEPPDADWDLEEMSALSSKLDEDGEPAEVMAAVAEPEPQPTQAEPDATDPDLIPGADDFIVTNTGGSAAQEQPVEEPREDAAPTVEEPQQPPEEQPPVDAPVAQAEPPSPSEADPAEIALWEKALSNPSPVIRREAARKLKKLTGRDYDA